MVWRRSILQRGSVWIGLGLLVLCPKSVSAVVVARDNADPADPAYADGWDSGDNGGFGFGAWGGGVSGVFTHEIDTVGQPDNNIGTPAFRFGAENQIATRPFANPMQAGQTFKMNLDKYKFDPSDPPDYTYIEQDSLIQLNSDGPIAGQIYERFSLYDWVGKYNDGAGTTTSYNPDEWGIGADSAVDNLHGGVALQPSGGLFKPGFSGADSEQGFSMILDLPTVDTYRLRIVQNGTTKVDVSGQLESVSDPDGANKPLPPGNVVGQPLNSLLLWFTPGDFTDGLPAAYFNNLEIDGAAAGVSGDFNGNGVVDMADYVLWRKGGPLQNDPTSGVSPSDYTYWRSRFGATSGSGALSGSAVPEPASFLLFVLTASALACRRRGR
jgi:hypothetical protein